MEYRIFLKKNDLLKKAKTLRETLNYPIIIPNFKIE